MGSHSAKALSDVFETRRVFPDGRYRHRRRHLVVNWGNGHLPVWGTIDALNHMLNKPQHVAVAADKILTFQRLTQACPEFVVPWTIVREEAREWLAHPIYGNLKNAAVCRTLTRAYSGRGIVLASTADELVNAPLYTRYKPKQMEYRVHVSSRYGIIDAQEKRRRNGEEDPNLYIRSHDNGWVFCREDVELPENVKVASFQAVAALGLDFGAVDIGYHDRYGVGIYEVNTAPGLEGQTLVNYVTMFKRYMVNA